MKEAACVAVAAALLSGSAAHAQSAGTTVVGGGWMRIAPQDSSDPLEVGGHGIPNTGTRVDNADTLGITVTHFFTDNLAVETVAGIPPRFRFYGKGALASASINPLGDVRQWSPALVFKYYFGRAESTWRPYLGLGVSYIWFTGGHVNPAFQQALSMQLSNGATAGMPTSARIDSAWSPVFNAGMNYNFDKHWSAGLSISYLPFGTKAKLTTRMPNGASVTSVAKIGLDPLVTYVSINYAF
ncbi:OmpW family protein [Burkholderia sp. lig30]|jgi:outer membrane protein|uniref:OmpW/AlkL family protein n=1 Tax=Burkholderia sp. lig30 TaxID=1192124 RepID=UPI0004618A2A|nr:OmpW family outer membrane protein [Burkholderia sp. lig30]KDB07788.1 OmpW family protein [Burkholderia sp. lig30]